MATPPVATRTIAGWRSSIEAVPALARRHRKSDLFFVLGRWAGKHMGEKEYLWERGLSTRTRRR